MTIQNLIARFNQPDVHLVVSEWPSRSPNIPHHGVAAFTRETLITLARNHSMRFVVLSETNDDNSPQLVENGKILVLRVFDHRHQSLYPIILTWLGKFSAIDHVTVHSEFNAYTGLLHVLLLLPFLTLIKLTGKKITYIAHNVFDSLENFAPYLNMTNDKYIHRLLSQCIGWYYMVLGKVTDQVIALDWQAYKKLSPFITRERLSYIPHWVKPRRLTISKATARKALGIPLSDRVIVSFGFISWYKGSDMLARLFRKYTPKNCRLIFAGGKHVVRENDATYKTYHKQFETIVKATSGITYTGFLPEQDIERYYAAADLVVLPYRELIGGSGALSWAVGCKKPFLVSENMKALFKNPDIQKSMRETRILERQISFSLDASGMKKIGAVAGDTKRLKKLVKLANAIRRHRDIQEIGKTFYNEIYAKGKIPRRSSAWRLSFS